MKLNKKGITLIEIIVSIVLISIVLVFIAILLIDVKDINDNSKINSTYLINKALITKIIEEDIMEYDKIKISSCGSDGVKKIYSAYDKDDIDENKNKFSECLKLTFDDDSNNYAYLGLFYLNTHSSYVVSYIHGTSERKTYDFNEFDKYNVNDDGNIKSDNLKMNVIVSNGTSVRYFDALGTFNSSASAIVINIPMIGNDGIDYTITIPYYGEVSIG